MDTPARAEVFLFEDFRLSRTGLSRRDQSGAFVPVSIGSRALEILAVLVARAGELVSRDELISAVWRASIVEDSNLGVQIAALRRVLDQGRANRSFIQTVPGRGYRFVAAVTAGIGADRSAPGNSPVSAPPRLSIVVLPFTNLSNDPEQQYFADGVTEELTTDLSRLAGMFVISRNTAFTYRGKRVDTKQIGRELGVRYVLEGSVRRSDNSVRVNAQLIDAELDAHVWAERFDADAADLFALQDEITSRIANTLDVELVAREGVRETRNPDALDFLLRGRAANIGPQTRESCAEQIGWFERALALAPGSAEAQCWLANALASRQMNFASDSAESDIERAEALTLRALATAPRNPFTHYARAQVLRVQGRLDEAIAAYGAVLAFNPNMVHALANLGRCRIYLGPIDEAITAQLRAIRLSPRDPNIGLWYFRIGQAHLLRYRFDEAIQWLEKARDVEPRIPFVHAYLAATHALLGNSERAAAELATSRSLNRRDVYSSIARLKFVHQLSQGRGTRPEIRELFEATYYAGLRKAGMPEE